MGERLRAPGGIRTRGLHVGGVAFWPLNYRYFGLRPQIRNSKSEIRNNFKIEKLQIPK
jgi:hypothetical protein